MASRRDEDATVSAVAFISVYQLSRSCSLLNFSLTLTHACSLITAMALIGSGGVLVLWKERKDGGRRGDGDGGERLSLSLIPLIYSKLASLSNGERDQHI